MSSLFCIFINNPMCFCIACTTPYHHYSAEKRDGEKIFFLQNHEML